MVSQLSSKIQQKFLKYLQGKHDRFDFRFDLLQIFAFSPFFQIQIEFYSFHIEARKIIFSTR